MSNIENRNWAAASQWIQRADADRARLETDLCQVRVQLADANTRMDMMGQQIQNLQAKMMILNGSYRG